MKALTFILAIFFSTGASIDGICQVLGYPFSNSSWTPLLMGFLAIYFITLHRDKLLNENEEENY